MQWLSTTTSSIRAQGEARARIRRRSAREARRVEATQLSAALTLTLIASRGGRSGCAELPQRRGVRAMENCEILTALCGCENRAR